MCIHCICTDLRVEVSEVRDELAALKVGRIHAPVERRNLTSSNVANRVTSKLVSARFRLHRTPPSGCMSGFIRG